MSDTTQSGPTRSWASSLLRLAVGVGLFVAVLIWLAPSWPEVAARARPRWGYLALGLLGTALGTAAASARWKLLAESLGDTRLPYLTYFHVFALNRVLAQFLPAVLVDLIGRSVTLRAAGSQDSVGRLSTIVVLERVLDVVLPAWILAWALAVDRLDPSSTAVWVGLAGVVVVFSGSSAFLLRPTAAVALGIYRRLRPGPRDTEPVPELPSGLARQVVGLTIGRYASLVIQFWGLAVGVGVLVELPTVLWASPVAQLASIIAITPGGLGFQEGGWAAALQWQGLDAVATSLFVLSSRFGMLLAFAVLTAITWKFGRRSAPKE